jgi:hypothetical protein
MKKMVFAAVFVFLLVAGSPLFAQNIPEDRQSEFYYVNVSLERIFPHRAGYIVQYRTGLSRITTAYLPAAWFTDAASKGEILYLPQGTSWPSLSVFYENGVFSHVRLFVHRMASHETWGNVPQNARIDHLFVDTDDFRLEF